MLSCLSRTSNNACVFIIAMLVAVGSAVAQTPAPVVAGISLGMSAPQARAIAGRAEREAQSLGMRFWEYPGRGITLIWKEGTVGVHGIVVTRNSAGAGAVAGVTVGDSEQTLRKLWGTPARVRQEGRFLDFVGAGWVLTAELRDGTIVEITLMGAS